MKLTTDNIEYFNVRTESGPAPCHIDCHRDGSPRQGPTHLQYIDSIAKNPPDILLVGETEYIIEAGLTVSIPIGVQHSVLSSDPDSHRTFLSIDNVTRLMVMMVVGEEDSFFVDTTKDFPSQICVRDPGRSQSSEDWIGTYTLTSSDSGPPVFGQNIYTNTNGASFIFYENFIIPGGGGEAQQDRPAIGQEGYWILKYNSDIMSTVRVGTDPGDVDDRLLEIFNPPTLSSTWYIGSKMYTNNSLSGNRNFITEGACSTSLFTPQLLLILLGLLLLLGLIVGGVTSTRTMRSGQPKLRNRNGDQQQANNIGNHDLCFPAGTPILTDQGIIAIDQLDKKKHSIDNKRIVDIILSVNSSSHLVCIKKHALGNNYPSKKTIMTKEHRILYKNEMVEAGCFVEHFDRVKKICYTGETLYSVLMETHERINVNNLICETLHPATYLGIKLFNSEPTQYKLFRKTLALFRENKKQI